MGLGYGAGAAGAIIILLSILNFLLAVALWLGSIYWRRKRKAAYPKSDRLIKIILIILSILPITTTIALIEITIQNYFTNQQRQRETEERFQQLSTPLQYGELLMPSGTWVNREGPYSELSQSDISYGIKSARFPTAVPIAEILANAFSLHNSLIIELAHDYTLNNGDELRECPAGSVLQFDMPEGFSTSDVSQTNFDWFTPSQWKPASCFDQGLSGIIVLMLGEYGIVSAPRPKYK